jgi:hypothetical protein
MNPDIHVLPGIFQGTDGRQFKPGAPGLNVVGVFEAASVYGGGSSSPPSRPTPSQPANSSNEIVLKNIQYIPQQYPNIRMSSYVPKPLITPFDTISYPSFYIMTPNPDKFCGVAAALMVRSKSAKNTEIIPDSGDAIRASFETLVDGLYNGIYGGGRIDVNGDGLLYVYQDWYGRTDERSVREQFDITGKVLIDVYTAQKQSPRLDNISIDRGFVTSISISCMPLDDALNEMWRNIENKREPAVAVANLNKIHKIRAPRESHGTDVALHYIVIAGVRKNNGVREFYVFDPWNTRGMHWYPESQMRMIMEVDSSYPYWLGYLPAYFGIYSKNPCYVGLINQSWEEN